MSPESSKKEDQVMVGRFLGIPMWVSRELFDSVAELRGQGKNVKQIAEELDRQPRVVRRIFSNLEKRDAAKRDQDKS